MKKRVLKNIEWGILICVILLITVGIIALYSATNETSREELQRQLMWLTISIPIVILVGVFLSLLIGTRAGLFGFSLIIVLYIFIEVLFNIVKKNKVNKKTVFIGVGTLLTISLIVIVFGSNTIQRRKHLADIESNIIDENQQENSHITGDLLAIKEKIEKNELENNYMSEEQKKSVIDLYNIANRLNVKNNDQRTQQLIYNIALVKNQKNIFLILFGNGYMANFRELVFEMEVPAILLNFGILGFILYLGPFIVILIKGLYIGIKKRKMINDEYVFLLLGCGFSFALSFFSGYTFFNSSTMMVIIVLNTVLYTIGNPKKLF